MRNLCLSSYYWDDWNEWSNIIPVLTKHSNSLIKLRLCNYLSLSFVSSFYNLQEIVLTQSDDFDSFEDLQHVICPKLKTFKIIYSCLNPMYVMKFLEINGKNLKTLNMSINNKP